MKGCGFLRLQPRSGVMTSIFFFDNVVCCVSLYIDAKAREAYSTGQNVYVPSPQV